jgi:hypothetical protein
MDKTDRLARIQQMKDHVEDWQKSNLIVQYYFYWLLIGQSEKGDTFLAIFLSS